MGKNCPLIKTRCNRFNRDDMLAFERNPCLFYRYCNFYLLPISFFSTLSSYIVLSSNFSRSFYYHFLKFSGYYLSYYLSLIIQYLSSTIFREFNPILTLTRSQLDVSILPKQYYCFNNIKQYIPELCDSPFWRPKGSSLSRKPRENWLSWRVES